MLTLSTITLIPLSLYTILVMSIPCIWVDKPTDTHDKITGIDCGTDPVIRNILGQWCETCT